MRKHHALLLSALAMSAGMTMNAHAVIRGTTPGSPKPPVSTPPVIRPIPNPPPVATPGTPPVTLPPVVVGTCRSGQASNC